MTSKRAWQDDGFDSEVDKQRWRDKLRDYRRIGDRGAEPCFVGRGDLFDLVDDMIESSEYQPDSRTLVIQGAPGVGKSGFLRELTKRRIEDGRAVPVEVEPDDLHPSGLMGAIAVALGMVEHQGASSRKIGVAVELKAAGVAGAGVKGEWAKQREASFRALAQNRTTVPWDLIAEQFGDALGGRPILLMCDEAQVLDAANDPLVEKTARSLHRGPINRTGVRLVPVFAGLADTESILGGFGISRGTGGNFLMLDGMSRAESAEYALKVLGHLEARGTGADFGAWRDWVVQGGDNWPQHNRLAMEAVAEEMLRADTPTLALLDRQRIRTRVGKKRDAFYQRRFNAIRHMTPLKAYDVPLKTVAELVAAAKRPGGADLISLKRLAMKSDAMRNAPDPPKAGELLHGLIRAGILQRVPEGVDMYACPIPSMYGWLETGSHQALEPPAPSRGGLSR